MKARHDVDRLRRAVDRSDVEKKDHLHQVTAVKQALQVSFNGDVSMTGKRKLHFSALI